MGSLGYSSGVGSASGKSTDVENLEEVARREIERELKRTEQEPERRRVFISFQFEDRDLVNMLRGQAKNENSELEFIDNSLKVPFDSTNAEYIKRGIRERIARSSVTLVAIGETTHESKWVDWEIQESIRQGKGVVAVRLNEKCTKYPHSINANKDKVEVVDWKQSEITDAINRAAME